MCQNGQCGNFDGTGSWRLTALANNRQPRIPGVTLPRAFILVSPKGETFSEGSYEDPILGAFPAGLIFSKDGGHRFLRCLKSRGHVHTRLRNKLAQLINRREDMSQDVSHVFKRAGANFTRPMLAMNDFQSGPSVSISVYRKGERLVFGRHPLAGISFSFMDALEMIERLRVDLQITHADERRLREDLANNIESHYRIPLTTPEELKMISDALPTAPKFVQMMATELLG